MSWKFRTIFLVLMIVAQSFAEADVPAVERTPIPHDVKPLFTPLLKNLGSWNCSVLSSRRSVSFPATIVTWISRDGYWMITKTVTPPVAWNPIAITQFDYVTYDVSRRLWVDLTMDNYGLYGFSTSSDGLTWNDLQYPTSHATAVHFPRIVKYPDANRMVTITAFAEPTQRAFTVMTTCVKSRQQHGLRRRTKTTTSAVLTATV